VEIRVSPTRMELLNLKKRQRVAIRGHKLLKDKLDELMKTFLELVEENRRLRNEVETSLSKAFMGFTMARATISREYLENAISSARTQAKLEATTTTRMSVAVPHFRLVENHKEAEGRAENIYPYGLAETSSELDEAIRLLNASFKSLIQLAQVEKTVESLAAEIERTRRRVNALEYVMIPQLQEKIKYITMKLDENERANLTRLMKVKAMVSAQT
jgi:V/A-type H+-transporting ATPase subunit D